MLEGGGGQRRWEERRGRLISSLPEVHSSVVLASLRPGAEAVAELRGEHGAHAQEAGAVIKQRGVEEVTGIDVAPLDVAIDPIRREHFLQRDI